MVNLFNNHFSCSRYFEKLTSDLYGVTQGTDEPLIDYVNGFRKEVLDIPHLDIATTVEDFKMILKIDSPFYEDLVMTPCKKLDEVGTRALRFIRLEEDKKIQKSTNTSYDHLTRKMCLPPKSLIELNLTQDPRTIGSML